MHSSVGLLSRLFLTSFITLYVRIVNCMCPSVGLVKTDLSYFAIFISSPGGTTLWMWKCGIGLVFSDSLHQRICPCWSYISKGFSWYICLHYSVCCCL